MKKLTALLLLAACSCLAQQIITTTNHPDPVVSVNPIVVTDTNEMALVEAQLKGITNSAGQTILSDQANALILNRLRKSDRVYVVIGLSSKSFTVSIH